MFEVNPGVSIWTIVIFVILLIVLKKFAWKPILSMLETRENKIRDSLETADQIKTEALQSLNEYKGLMGEAKNEHARILQKAERDAEKLKESIINEANKESKAMLDKSRDQIALEREQAFEELKKKSTELSISMAQKLVSSVMTEEKQKIMTKKVMEEIAKKL